MTIIFKLLLTYIAVSFFTGAVVGALGYETFAIRWLIIPPTLITAAGGVSLFIAFIWWG